MALHDRTVAVLDALAYGSVNETSPCVAIGLTRKPLQLVVTMNEEIPSPTILENLNTICSILKNISDAKFCTCPDLNFSNADLRKESPDPGFVDNSHISREEAPFCPGLALKQARMGRLVREYLLCKKKSLSREDKVGETHGSSDQNEKPANGYKH